MTPQLIWQSSQKKLYIRRNCHEISAVKETVLVKLSFKTE